MMDAWRPLAVAAALVITLGTGIATAQTVIVKGAPAGSTIELALNSATIATGKADNQGNATLVMKEPAAAQKDASRDVRAFVDACGKETRRVLLVEPGADPPAKGPGCERSEIAGVFVARRTTTFLVDVGGATPMLWLRQGPIPAAWLTSEAGAGVATVRRNAPTGLVVFGGGGMTQFRDPVVVACGDVQDCDGKTFKQTYAVGAGFWITRFLGVEATYVKPAEVSVTGGGTNFSFDTGFDARLFTIAADGGVPVGPVRFYGKAGATYHRATFTTTETIGAVTITVDDTPQTIPGGTQTSSFETDGWGWLFGGGMEAWASNRVAIYGEVAYTKLKGTDRAGGEAAIDDRATLILFGVRVRLGK